MTGLVFHNTLTGQTEPFSPMRPGQAGLYVCGITPYDETHLGHARCYVVFDVLKRVLKSHGFAVTHIQNFTDVDDKIIERARQKNVPAVDYPKKFMEGFLAQMDRLNVQRADRYPLVTTHMPQIIRLVSDLVGKGLAYELDGSVYFKVRAFDAGSFPLHYGDLSKRNIDELEAGARVEVDERKNDPLDFALWKKSKEGEPSWSSPWGGGRPGWHIECSAMSMEYLGTEFDIHGGGLDLVFPHHTNEIAQSVGATGRRFAHFWMHNGFVTVNHTKMSKSLGNFFTLSDIFGKFDPMSVRYFLLTQHYRSPLNFSDVELAVADKTWRDRVCGAYRIAQENARRWNVTPDMAHVQNTEFRDALADDLNTPRALAALNLWCTQIFHDAADQKGVTELRTLERGAWAVALATLQEMLDVLGLRVPAEESWPEEILALVRQRQEARTRKDWAMSDKLRDELKMRGVVVEDKSDGPRLKKV